MSVVNKIITFTIRCFSDIVIIYLSNLKKE